MTAFCSNRTVTVIIDKAFSGIKAMNTMQINVSQLLKEGIGSVRDYEISGTIDTTDSGGSSPIRGEVRLMRTSRSILVKGKLYVTIDATCSRCLKTFDCPLTLDIEEEFFPVLDASSGTPLPLPDEPSSFSIDEHQVLDLSEVARQYAILAIPMKPLCRNDCPGMQLNS